MARKAAVLAHVEAFGEAYAVEIAERIDWPANARRGRAQRIALIRSTLQQLEDEGKLVGETRYEGPGVRRYYRIRIEP